MPKTITRVLKSAMKSKVADVVIKTELPNQVKVE